MTPPYFLLLPHHHSSDDVRLPCLPPPVSSSLLLDPPASFSFLSSPPPFTPSPDLTCVTPSYRTCSFFGPPTPTPPSAIASLSFPSIRYAHYYSYLTLHALHLTSRPIKTCLYRVSTFFLSFGLPHAHGPTIGRATAGQINCTIRPKVSSCGRVRISRAVDDVDRSLVENHSRGITKTPFTGCKLQPPDGALST